jgi:hypothetical protein
MRSLTAFPGCWLTPGRDFVALWTERRSMRKRKAFPKTRMRLIRRVATNLSLWAAERLKPDVKPVTVQELLMRVRLRLRPQTTLSTWLAELEKSRDAQLPSSMSQPIRELLPQTGRDSSAARRCFELLKSAAKPNPKA